jgi:hypothetical protein
MNENSKKRALNDEALRECAALNAIYKAKKRELGVTQELIAIEGLKANSQSAASHYLTGRNALNAEAAAVFANYLQVQIQEFSPRLAAEIALMAQAVDPSGSEIAQAYDRLRATHSHLGAPGNDEYWSRFGCTAAQAYSWLVDGITDIPHALDCISKMPQPRKKQAHLPPIKTIPISGHDLFLGIGYQGNLADMATPRSREVLARLANAACAGRLTEDDLTLLDQIAARFEANSQASGRAQGSHKNLRDKLSKNDQNPKQ